MLADRIEQIVHGQNLLFKIPQEVENLSQHYASLITNNKLKKTEPIENTETDFCEVDINSIKTTDVRTIGAEYLGYSYFKRLKFDKILKSVGLNDNQIKLAATSIPGRLINPTSELGTFGWLQDNSGLKELLQIDDFSLTSFYKIADS